MQFEDIMAVLEGIKTSVIDTDISIKRVDNGFVIKSIGDTIVFEDADRGDLGVEMSAVGVLHFVNDFYSEYTGNKHSNHRVIVSVKQNEDTVYEELSKLVKSDELAQKIYELFNKEIE